MRPEEFSNEFDVLLASYAQEANFGEEASKVTLTFNEYEKSVFLTEAQNEIVIGLYTGKNPYGGESFEMTEELRRYLSNLVAHDTKTPITNLSGMSIGGDSNSYFFTLPDDLWFITYESVKIDPNLDSCKAGTVLPVYPTKQDEFHKIKKNPYRGANSRRALRFDLSDGVIEIVCKYPVASYYVRYLIKPEPIILTNLDGLQIEGHSDISGCVLHEALHPLILNRAVEKALQSRGIYAQRDNRNN